VSSLAIVIPARDEEESLPATLRDCLSTFEGDARLVELIVVDDESSDGTSELVRSYAQRDPRVSLLANDERLGCIPSTLRGFRQATAEFCFFLPADGQIGAIEARRALDVGEAGSDLVLTRRKTREDSAVRRLASDFYNRALKLLAPGLPGSDVDSSFLIRRRFVELAPAPTSGTSFASVDLFLSAVRNGASATEITIDHRPRTAGKETGLEPREVLGAIRGLSSLLVKRLRQPGASR
jgi:glycosyltransferase involved in cell wall biosynthesis